jgi:hypothetical protein
MIGCIFFDGFMFFYFNPSIETHGGVVIVVPVAVLPDLWVDAAGLVKILMFFMQFYFCWLFN